MYNVRNSYLMFHIWFLVRLEFLYDSAITSDQRNLSLSSFQGNTNWKQILKCFFDARSNIYPSSTKPDSVIVVE